jgi:hypothetical protein
MLVLGSRIGCGIGNLLQFLEIPRRLQVLAEVDLLCFLGWVWMFELIWLVLAAELCKELGNDGPLEDMFCVVKVSFLEESMSPFPIIGLGAFRWLTPTICLGVLQVRSVARLHINDGRGTYKS